MDRVERSAERDSRKPTGLLRLVVRRPRWTHYLGSTAMFLLALQVVTGFLLLMFDGLDEMAVHVDEEVIHANMAQIELFAASPNSRILLTSRPEYFKTSQEEQQVLQPVSGHGI